MVESEFKTAGCKELKTNWPVTEGTTAGTTKQTGKEMRLVPQESVVADKDLVGVN